MSDLALDPILPAIMAITSNVTELMITIRRINLLRLITILIVLFFWLSAVSGEAAAGRSVIDNRSMSDGSATPAGWSLADYRVGEITLARDKSVFRSEPSSLRVDAVGENASGFAHYRIDAQAGETVQVIAWLRAKGTFKSIQLAAQVFDDQWKQIAWLPILHVAEPKDDWREHRGQAVIPVGASHVLLGLAVSGQGSVWLDDVNASTLAKPGEKVIAPAVELPVKVPMTDAAIRLTGRFDTSDPSAPQAAWSATAVAIAFNGTALNVKFQAGNDRFQVVVDGEPANVITASPGRQRHSVVSDLPAGEHIVELVKCTEPIFGTVTFLGFELDEGATTAKPPPRPDRRIAVIGDSISCGYGNEAANEKEKFSHTTENAYWTYAAIAARRFNAELMVTAWSGKLMWPNNTIAEVYDRTLPKEENSHWNYEGWTADVVVILLGANDFAGGTPDEAGWVTAYADFIGRVRKHYPAAVFLLCTSPTMSDHWGKAKNARSTLIDYLEKVASRRAQAGDAKVHVVPFETQKSEDGFGADWHPNVKTHTKMAEALSKAITKYVGWNEVKQP